MILHIRDEQGSQEAFKDSVNILHQYEFKTHPGVIHCFIGDEYMAKSYTALGFFLGIGGKVTHTKETDVQKIAELKGVTDKEVEAITYKNAECLFRF